MSNSAKNYVVPWVNKSEWLLVREKLTSSKVEDVIEAYEYLSTWKARSDALPAFVECTYGILKVMVQDYMLKTSGFNDYDTRLSYSTEIIRFVNHVHSVTKVKGSSLYNSAKINNIPDWIVTMRHEAAHGQTLPALETFHLAAKVCMNWLLKNYWFLKEKFTSKLDQSFKLYAEEFLANNVNVRLYALYKKTIKLWEACCEISNSCLISDLPNDNLYYVSNLVRLYKSHEYTSKGGDYCDLLLKRLNSYCVNSNEHRLKDFKRSVIELMKYLTSHERPRNTFIYTVMQADFMFDFFHVEWKEVIYFIQVVKCFEIFVKSLFDQVTEDNMVAMKVLDTLAPSIEILKRQWPKFKERFRKKSLDKKEKLRLKKKYCKSYKGLRFPLKLQKPPTISLEMLDDLFRSPSIFTRPLITRYLPLIDPSLSRKTIHGVTRLLDIYCEIDTDMDHKIQLLRGGEDRVYTLEDIKAEFDPECRFIRVGFQPRNPNQKWRTSDQDSEFWSSCPIGLLPNESDAHLTIPEEFVCQEMEPTGAHPLPPLGISQKEMNELLDFGMTLE